LPLARFHTQLGAETRKTQDDLNGMAVARSTAIAFVPTKLGAWLTKGGRTNALDDFCNSVGLVVTGRRK
jgi:hypothetical protein